MSIERKYAGKDATEEYDVSLLIDGVSAKRNLSNVDEADSSSRRHQRKPGSLQAPWTTHSLHPPS